MTIALIDGDIVAYRCAASAEKNEEEVAFIRASRQLQDIISVTDADEIKLFLSGSNNFRYALYPEYKANRKDMVRPKHLQRVREYLVLKWGAVVCDGYEADDALGMENGSERVVCSIDKDLKQLAGLHYNFVANTFEEVNEIEGWRNFYRQLILGDKADNIPGFDGKSRVKFPKFLEELRQAIDSVSTDYDMFRVCLDAYKDDIATLTRNARLLYIWRKLNDLWQPPTAPVSTSEVKPETGVKSVSTVTTPEETTRSTGRTTTKRNKSGYRVRGRSKASSSTKKRREV